MWRVEENKSGIRAQANTQKFGSRAGRPAKVLKINRPAFRRRWPKGAGGKRCTLLKIASRKTPFEWKLARRSGSAKRYLSRGCDPKTKIGFAHLWNWMKPPLTNRFRHVGTEHDMTMVRPPITRCEENHGCRIAAAFDMTHSLDSSALFPPPRPPPFAI